MSASEKLVSTERIPLPLVEGVYYTKDIAQRDIRRFFQDHPAEDFVSLELLPNVHESHVRVGMMRSTRLTYGTFARIERAAVTIRGFHQSGSAAFLTGKRLSSSIVEFRSLFDAVIEGLLSARLANHADAKWISFCGVNDSCFAFDGLSWRSMIPCSWLAKSSSSAKTLSSQYGPNARVIGVMDGHAYALSMEITRDGQDAESTSIRPFQQRVEFHYSANPANLKPEWKRSIIEHSRPRVHGVGFMARVKTPAPHESARPRSGYMRAPDSILSHITYANRTVSMVNYYPGQATYSFGAPEMLEGWPTPPTVLAVVRPDPEKPAKGVIVQELQPDKSCLLHYLHPDQVPKLYKPYLESFRP